MGVKHVGFGANAIDAEIKVRIIAFVCPVELLTTVSFLQILTTSGKRKV